MIQYKNYETSTQKKRDRVYKTENRPRTLRGLHGRVSRINTASQH